MHDKAGERILEQLLAVAEQRLREEGIRGVIYLFKNNTDSAGNSYGCHENYLTSRRDDFGHYAEVLIPFLVSRQIYAGAGKVLQTARGAMYCISQRAEHIWEGVSSATTRQPADHQHPRRAPRRRRALPAPPRHRGRLEHERVRHLPQGRGDRRSCCACSRSRSVVLRDMTLENPIRAIREISHDITCTRRVRLANGREAIALDIQTEYLNRALRYADTPRPLARSSSRPSRCGSTASPASRRTRSSLDRECDWVIKHNLIEAYRERHDLPLTHPQVALIDLQYHDVNRERGLFYRMQDRGMVDRICTDEDIDHAVDTPPQTTRARLRGEFIRKAKERKRDYTVDWVHLKLNDQAQRTVLCKDPFKAHDERVEKLIASL